MPVSAIALVRKAAPARMNMIMQESRVAPIRLSLKLFHVRVRVTAARMSDPSTPKPAASVAVAQPINMVPITAMIRMAQGINCALARIFSWKLSAGSLAGCLSGFSTAQIAI